MLNGLGSNCAPPDARSSARRVAAGNSKVGDLPARPSAYATASNCEESTGRKPTISIWSSDLAERRLFFRGAGAAQEM
jgi:hypothetical protein